MELTDLATLLNYHYWARDRMLAALAPLAPEVLTRDLGSSFKSIRDTANHIYLSEWAWQERWHGRSPSGPPPLDKFHDIASLRAAWTELEAQVRGLLDRFAREGRLNEVIRYKMFSGQEASSVFWHMLQHVVNHATYHRGQLTTMLRQIGAPPPESMDLIRFYRDRR